MSLSAGGIGSVFDERAHLDFGDQAGIEEGARGFFHALGVFAVGAPGAVAGAELFDAAAAGVDDRTGRRARTKVEGVRDAIAIAIFRAEFHYPEIIGAEDLTEKAPIVSGPCENEAAVCGRLYALQMIVGWAAEGEVPEFVAARIHTHEPPIILTILRAGL